MAMESVAQARIDLRRITFDAMLAEVILTTSTLQDLTCRDNAGSVAGLVENARRSYQEILRRQGSVLLSGDEASLLGEKLNRLEGELRYFAEHPRGYEA